MDKRQQAKDVLSVLPRHCPSKPCLMGLRITESGDHAFNEQCDGVLLIALCFCCTRIDWNSAIFRPEHILRGLRPSKVLLDNTRIRSSNPLAASKTSS